MKAWKRCEGWLCWLLLTITTVAAVPGCASDPGPRNVGSDGHVGHNH